MLRFDTMIFMKRLAPCDTLLRHTGWMMVSEAVSKGSRIATVFGLAALLSATDYGVAALAMLLHETFRVFTRAGGGALVIQCEASVLSRVAASTNQQQWLMSTLVFVLQVTLAHALASYYQMPTLAPVLQISALAYFIYPLVSVRVFLAQRANRMKYFALATSVSISVDNLSTLLFLVLGQGVYAVALGKVSAALVWAGLFLSVANPIPLRQWHWPTAKRVAVFSCKILSTELLRQLRFQVDSLILARVLSPEVFGLYSFAKNAGVGLGQSLSNAYLATALPYLADRLRAGSAQQGQRNVLKIAGALSFIFIAQAAMAPIYVGLLFPDRWQNAGPLVAILCLIAVPALALDIVGIIERVHNRPMNEVLLMLGCVGCTFCILLLFSPGTIDQAAWTVLASSALWLLWLIPIGTSISAHKTSEALL